MYIWDKGVKVQLESKDDLQDGHIEKKRASPKSSMHGRVAREGGGVRGVPM